MLKNNSEKKTINKNWWKWFWSTIIILLISYIIMIFIASSKIKDRPIEDQKAILSELVEKIQSKYPELKEIFSTLPKGSKDIIKKSINENIDKAYSNVYGKIDTFSDFHYSITGEYTEIFMALSKKINKLLYERIFIPSHFQQNLNKSLENINNDTNEILKKHYDLIKEQLKSKMDINENQTNFLLQNVFKFTQEDMLNRFKNNLANTFRSFGLAGGTLAGREMTKAISASIAKMITKKIVTKAAIKGGSKLAGVGAGAMAGGESGLLCGPGAWLCSPVGAVVGGIAGWFIIDKIVIEVDQFFNEEEFKEELKKMIDEQKEQTKQTIYKIYQISSDNLMKENINKIEEIKKRTVLEILNQESK